MPAHEPSLREDEVARSIGNAATKVHRSLGPGLWESVYEQCLAYELEESGLNVQWRIPVPVKHRNLRFDTGFRLDPLVEDAVIVELKAVEQLMPLYDAQFLTYLKLTDKHLAFLTNLNEPLLKHGIKRFVRSSSS